MKGILWGVLALTILDLALTSDVVTSLPVALAGVARWVKNWIDPSVPFLTQSGNLTTAAAPPVKAPPAPVMTLAQPRPGSLPSSVSVA